MTTQSRSAGVEIRMQCAPSYAHTQLTLYLVLELFFFLQNRSHYRCRVFGQNRDIPMMAFSYYAVTTEPHARWAVGLSLVWYPGRIQDPPLRFHFHFHVRLIRRDRVNVM